MRRALQRVRFALRLSGQAILLLLLTLFIGVAVFNTLSVYRTTHGDRDPGVFVVDGCGTPGRGGSHHCDGTFTSTVDDTQRDRNPSNARTGTGFIRDASEQYPAGTELTGNRDSDGREFFPNGGAASRIQVFLIILGMLLWLLVAYWAAAPFRKRAAAPAGRQPRGV